MLKPWSATLPSEYVALEADLRFVSFEFCAHPANNWKIGARGGQDHWVVAEDLLEKRRLARLLSSADASRHLAPTYLPFPSTPLRVANTMPLRRIKCVVVGDNAVGKTCLLVSLTTNEFPTQDVPPVLDNNQITVEVMGGRSILQLFDTAGLSQPGTFHFVQSHLDSVPFTSFRSRGLRVVLVCCSVACPSSFTNAKEKWFPELSHHCPLVPCLLVGTQVDLRDDSSRKEKLGRQNQRAVTNAEGWNLAREMGASRYLECSALTRKGLRDVFEEAIMVVLTPPRCTRRSGARCVVV
ncbi:GTP binding protein Cdc42 [Mycena venus]|uniref:GTP binding protein Cdc42 n=1 Tax=Mycena venus TaxID=2733690 RepID=A0A8H6Y6J3_9AGAR|nr:GTP binding protein Cdc42 [Mycena venus]